MLLPSGIQRTFLSGTHAEFKEVVNFKGEIYDPRATASQSIEMLMKL